MKSALSLAGLFTACALGACTPGQAEAPASRLQATPVAARATARPTPTPLPSATSAPTPVSAVPVQPPAAGIDAGYVAGQLISVEAAIRSPETDAFEYPALGHHQQQLYHLLAARKDLIPAVLAQVPSTLRDVIQANLTAAQQIDTLNGTSSHLPHWRIIAPPPPATLLGYYREAERSFGIQWQYLAAINLIETNMGRIQGLSSAGAQGPMQFMPATWASYGRGDVNNPRDAILAAGRYLQAAGAQRNVSRAIYAYNNSDLYVRAVTLYAQQMFANERAFLGYYNWQVYVPTDAGDVLLPEGFVN